jgi:hypothetical protein
MSEYQYYEFQAIDRSLTEREMSELRAYSTRARITPTSCVAEQASARAKDGKVIVSFVSEDEGGDDDDARVVSAL